MKIVTHNGGFHTDDVFAVATVMLSLGDKENVEIIRTRDKSVFETADFLIDVGGEYEPQKGRFDHHQPGGAGKRDNGIPYASFGLVWKEYGVGISSSQYIADEIERKLVMYVDAVDNGMTIDTPTIEGVRAYTISDYLYSYWMSEQISEEEVDKIFMQELELAKDLLRREIAKAKYIETEGKQVEEIYEHTEDKRLIVLDKHLAWGRVLVDKPEPLIVVYPSINGSWSAKAVRKNLDGFESRIMFPESWAGKKDEELVELSGVKGAKFCHLGRFLVTADTKEDAMALAEIALNA